MYSRHRTGSRSNGRTSRLRVGPVRAVDTSRSHLLLSEAVFAVWVAVALLSIGLGTTAAKYAQAWARSTVHPAALLGSGVVLGSVVLVLLAAGRHLQLSALLAASGRAGAVVGLAAVLVLLLGWVALAVIWAAGWDVPLAPQR